MPAGELPDIILRSLLHDSEVYLTLLDRQGRMVHFSRTDDAHPVHELLGQSLFDFTRPEYHQGFRNAIDRVFSEGSRQYVEAESIRGGWYGNHLSPVKLAGQVVAVC